MHFPSLTAAYSAVLALIFAGLSLWVIATRVKLRVNHGDGSNDGLPAPYPGSRQFRRIRAADLILLGFLETAGAAPLTIHILAIALIVARLMHPIGLLAPENSARQFAFRGTSVVATMSVMIASAVMLLARLA